MHIRFQKLKLLRSTSTVILTVARGWFRRQAECCLIHNRRQRLAWLLAAWLAISLASAGVGHAQVYGTVWVGDDSSDNADDVPSGTPSANFTSPAINYDTRVGGYTVGGFLNNAVFFNTSGTFSQSQSMDDTHVQLMGTVYLNAGSNSFVITHDDGVRIVIGGGIGTVLDSPGPAFEVSTPFSINAPAAGFYEFTLDYNECCGAPATLLWPVSLGFVSAPASSSTKNYGSQGTAPNLNPDGTPHCSGSGSSPIFAATGDYRRRVDDATLPCRGLPLQITRFYNSIEDYDGPFSFGWCFNQTAQSITTAATNGQTTAIVRWANGVRKNFTLTNGVYQAPIHCYDMLSSNTAGFLLQTPKGLQLQFNLGGFLIWQQDRNGNRTTYNHDLQNRISQAVSADGRSLELFLWVGQPRQHDSGLGKSSVELPLRWGR